MANFGPLAAEIGLGVSGTPANFNGSRVLASLLQRRRSPEDSQTLRWYTVYTFLGALTEFRHVQNSLCVQVLRYSTALQQRGQPNFSAWYKGWNYGTFAQCATIFGWAAITLGISPYSSLFMVCQKLIGYQKMRKLQWISIVTA